jgi:hypothetical protein
MEPRFRSTCKNKTIGLKSSFVTYNFLFPILRVRSGIWKIVSSASDAYSGKLSIDDSSPWIATVLINKIKSYYVAIFIPTVR